MSTTTGLDHLGASSYSLDEEESEFFKAETGIHDDEELRTHIVAVQEKAYKVHPYPCIRRFAFTKLKIARLPGYEQLLKLGKERRGAIFLDIGCCFGNDTRKAIYDGFPIEGVIASDLRREYWDIGHELFKSTPTSFQVPFLQGDIFSPTFLSPSAPLTTPPSTSAPPLSTLTTLTPLHGHISAIHASSLFHLFPESLQLKLAHALGSLLSPLPGSIIFGSHGAAPIKGVRVREPGEQGEYRETFRHSPESWKELWDGEVFEKGIVEVFTELREIQRGDLGSGVGDGANGRTAYWLLWWVKRL
ncbi:hypothetical protein JAAARDRAFT_33617 [Jaapia argillacea MUCL 33604]|uniref:Methyltransferase domain-containing protein n=1 Tax=Jaapia argillacea MUCL 33604 TaxID=933084 RepID=A0A067Q5V3_9AGAM|nr:hypothetical protein JAAARDRAFT_33617 [Jaapia argillacea MUCL 33604]